jgi:hypothetical protein
MGYRAQFPDWTDDSHKNNIDQYYDLENDAVVSSGAGGGAEKPRQLIAQILAGYPTSYPPDRTLVFEGAIGSFDTGLRWEHTADDLIAGFKDAAFPEGLTEIEACLFQYVTRRFVKSGIVHRQKTEKKAVGVDGKKKHEYTQSAAINEGKDWVEVALGGNGVMSVDDAKKYGITCYCSRVLRSAEANKLYGYGLTEKQAALIRPIPPTPFDDLQETAAAQLNALRRHFPYLRWYLLNDGSYFFYHEKETEKDLWNDPFVKERQEGAVILPAIYDMTPEGVRTIRCPFVSWVDPTMTVLFRSRFSKGTFTGYFYPVKTKAFLVISAKVEFATVSDDNEMTMACVDIAEEDAPAVDPATGAVTPKPSEAGDATPEAAKTWMEKTLEVVPRKTGAMNTDSRWAGIVEKELRPAFRPENWPEGQAFTEALALNALKDWNADYFDPGGGYMKRADAMYGKSIENAPFGIGGRTGIEVPWLKTGDKIKVRWPFLSEYPDDEKAE